MADTEWDFNEKRKREQEDYDLRRSDMLRDFQARLDDTQSYSSTRNQIEIQSVQKLNSELDTLENLRRLSVEYANKGILHDTISTYSQLDQIRDRWYNDPRVGGSGESQEGASRAFDWTQFQGGSYGRRQAFGGYVPGMIGSPQMILAHGGERIVPPATGSYYNNVRQGDQVVINSNLSFSNNVNGVNSSAVIDQASRTLGRAVRQARSFIGR